MRWLVAIPLIDWHPSSGSEIGEGLALQVDKDPDGRLIRWSLSQEVDK